MVMVLDDQEAVIPAGKPVAVPMPVAPVVVWVMAGFSGVLMQRVDVPGEGPLTVLIGLTLIVPEALTVPQPPVRGMV